jgi:hypothetical protein
VNEAEARKVQQICNSADGSCVYCAAALCRSLMAEFPALAQVFMATFQEEWPDSDPTDVFS